MGHPTYSPSEIASIEADAYDMEDYLVGEEEHRAFTYATDADFDREGARERGAENPDRAWILSDRDAWYPNPFYQGPPVKHPEDDYGEE